MNNSKTDISVIMATYNPIWDKCIFTLDSIIGQADVELELIIVDDGSKNNCFPEIETYLNRKDFKNYKLIDHSTNQGTVKNYYDGVCAAAGKYIKLISPGDALFNETSLYDWIIFLEESGKRWSFSDAVYYSSDNSANQIIKCPVAPRIIDCYEKNNESECIWNYVVLEDLPLGAAILCQRELFLEYLTQIIDVVVYSEDLSYVAMMYDGILPAYYCRPGIIYEFGCGVSTINDEKWRSRFHNDQKNAELRIADKSVTNELQGRITKALRKINSGDEKKKRLLKNLQKGGLKKVLKYRFDPRMSSTDITSCGQWLNDYISNSRCLDES